MFSQLDPISIPIEIQGFLRFNKFFFSMRTIFECLKNIRVTLLGFHLPCSNVLNSHSIYKELELIAIHIVDLT